MPKPTHYLWKTKDMDTDVIERQKQYWTKLGFRVVVFVCGNKEGNINEGLKEVLINHIKPS